MVGLASAQQQRQEAGNEPVEEKENKLAQNCSNDGHRQPDIKFESSGIKVRECHLQHGYDHAVKQEQEKAGPGEPGEPAAGWFVHNE